MNRVLASHPLPPEAIKRYEGRLSIDIPAEPLPYEALLDRLKSYDALFLLRGRADARLIAQNKHLKAIANFGVGYDNIDIACATAYGIAVINTPNAVTEATAEQAVALMLSAMRGTARHDRELRRGVWNAPPFSDADTTANGKTLGIVGLGRIGKSVARRARALGMHICYHNRRRLPESEEAALGARYLDLDALLGQSDCVSLHLPYTPENHGMFNKAAFDKMKPGAYLINTARGKLVNEEDLAHALQTGALRGAGLDVFADEPHVSPALLALENVTLAPHLGSATLETRLAMLHESLDGLCEALAGGVPCNIVNPEVLAKKNAR